MICPSLSCPSAGSQAGKECARNGGKESSAWGEMAEKSVGNTSWPRGPRGYLQYYQGAYLLLVLITICYYPCRGLLRLYLPDTRSCVPGVICLLCRLLISSDLFVIFNLHSFSFSFTTTLSLVAFTSVFLPEPSFSPCSAIRY